MYIYPKGFAPCRRPPFTGPLATLGFPQVPWQRRVSHRSLGNVGFPTGPLAAFGFPQVLWQRLVSHRSLGNVGFPTGPLVASGFPQVLWQRWVSHRSLGTSTPWLDDDNYLDRVRGTVRFASVCQEYVCITRNIFHIIDYLIARSLFGQSSCCAQEP